MIAGCMLRLPPVNVQRCCQFRERTAGCWIHLRDGFNKPAALAHSARHAILNKLALRHLTTTCNQNTWPGYTGTRMLSLQTYTSVAWSAVNASLQCNDLHSEFTALLQHGCAVHCRAADTLRLPWWDLVWLAQAVKIALDIEGSAFSQFDNACGQQRSRQRRH